MKLQDYVKQEFQDVKEQLNKIENKLDDTCDRLTTQEINFKNHIESKKQEIDLKINKAERREKYIATIISAVSGSSVLVALISLLR